MRLNRRVTDAGGPTSSGRAPFALDADAVEALRRAAAVALPVLDARPWRLDVGADGVEVFADRRRFVVAGDGAGRLLEVACGAAVLNMRLTLRQMGVEPVIRLAPRSPYPSLLAAVRIAGPAVHRLPEDRFRTLDAEAALHARLAGGAAGPADPVRRLREEAGLEGAGFAVLAPAEVGRALALLDEAAWALGTAPVDERGLLPRAGELPVLAVVTTATDQRGDRVRAGLALQRVALAGAEAGIRVRALTGVWECERTAGRVGALAPATHAGPVHPQMLVHLGWGRTADVAAPDVRDRAPA